MLSNKNRPSVRKIWWQYGRCPLDSQTINIGVISKYLWILYEGVEKYQGEMKKMKEYKNSSYFLFNSRLGFWILGNSCLAFVLLPTLSHYYYNYSLATWFLRFLHMLRLILFPFPRVETGNWAKWIAILFHLKCNPQSISLELPLFFLP